MSLQVAFICILIIIISLLGIILWGLAYIQSEVRQQKPGFTFLKWLKEWMWSWCIVFPVCIALTIWDWILGSDGKDEDGVLDQPGMQ